MQNSIPPGRLVCMVDTLAGWKGRDVSVHSGTARWISKGFLPNCHNTDTMDGQYWNGRIVSNPVSRVPLRGLRLSPIISSRSPKERLTTSQVENQMRN